MGLSNKHKQAVADLELEIVKAHEADVAKAFETITSHSETLKSVPHDFVRGYAERALLTDPTAHDAWHGRAERPENADAVIKRIAGDLEQVVERIHSAEPFEDDAAGDDDVKAATQFVRQTGGLSERLPSSLIEGVLINAFRADPEAEAAWDARGQNPQRVNNILKHVAYQLRPIADNLINATRPSAELPDGMDMGDLMEMDEKSWERYKRKVVAANKK